MGLSIADELPAATTATAKSCIIVYLTGGPPQHETFDPKPNATAGVRGEFSNIATAVPGFHVCEHLPKLAKIANDYSVIRSVYHDSSSFHAAGVHYNLTGHKHAPRPGQPLLSRRDAPSIGSVLQQLEGERRKGKSELPVAVQLPVWITQDGAGQEWAGQHAGFLGPKYDPLFMMYSKQRPGTLPKDFLPQARNSGQRLDVRSKLLKSLERSRAVARIDAAKRWDAFRDEAFGVLDAAPKWKAFCIDEEPKKTREMYGDTDFGRSCLVARRLTEAGVRVVTATWTITKELSHFDTHAGNFPTMKKNSPVMDQVISALITDLKQRGTLDETLVVVTAEFGRTPVINPNAGRDHWPSVYCNLIAGGGVRGGFVLGSSDKQGAVPKDDPVHCRDFIASIYHALGYDRNTRVVDYHGRPHYIVHGKPVRQLFV